MEVDPQGVLELLAAMVTHARREAAQGSSSAQEFMAALAELPRPRNVRFVEGEGSMLRGPGRSRYSL